MYTKAKIFNLALGALLSNKQVSNTETDTTTENQVLNVHYDSALRSTLQDLDLDSTCIQKNLELISTDPNDLWLFAYKYPSNCSFFRRIQSVALKDNRTTHIPRRIVNHNNIKAIYTNESDAIGEFIPHDLSLNVLSASAGLAVAYKLASLCSALVTGKAAVALRKQIMESYVLAKIEAQEQDRLENMSFDEDEVVSELVEARTS